MSKKHSGSDTDDDEVLSSSFSTESHSRSGNSGHATGNSEIASRRKHVTLVADDDSDDSSSRSAEGAQGEGAALVPKRKRAVERAQEALDGGGGSDVVMFLYGFVTALFFGCCSCWCCAPRGGRDHMFLAGATLGTCAWIIWIAAVGMVVCCIVPQNGSTVQS